MADVTLTAAMRANLYSLQGTATLMGTIQQRLASGKKVNSALDNPNSYFAAQSLTNRASDLTSLLDGMGQAIEALKTASQGITSAQKIVDQLKSVANSAAQSLTTASTAEDTNVLGYAPKGKLVTSAGTAVLATASANLLTDLVSAATSFTNQGIVAGDIFTVSNGTSTYTFTVGGETKTTADTNGGGASITDLVTWLGNLTGMNASVTTGGVSVVGTATTDNFNLGGSLATKLGFTGTKTAVAGTTATVGTGVYSAAAPVDAVAMNNTAGTETTHLYSLTNLVNRTTESLHILNGDQMSVTTGGATYSFTVGDTPANNSVKGNGGGTTMKDLETWMETVLGTTVTYGANGALALAKAGTDTSVTISGTLATELGVNVTNFDFSTATGANVAGSVSVYGATYSNLEAATATTKLSSLTDSAGRILSNVDTTAMDGGTGVGNYIKFTVNDGSANPGTVKTISISKNTTIQDVLNEINSIDGLTATIDPQGALMITNDNDGTVSISGTASGLIGVSNISAKGSASKTLYDGFGQVAPNDRVDPSTGSTIAVADILETKLVNLNSPSGQTRLASGDELKITTGGATTTIKVVGNFETADASKNEVKTVADLLTQLGKVSGITAKLDNTTGQLDIRSSDGQAITFSGSAAAKLSLPDTLAPGKSTLKSIGVSETYLKQYDELRGQLDKMVQDSGYKGINLLSSTDNNPLTVVFNEQALYANKLTISAVDLTTKGLNIDVAGGLWKDSGSIQKALAQLTDASTKLRDTASSLGQNLTTVQTRQDFTTNLIATLKSGADDLTLADMNEESANMLALQTRQQLGIQSLSLASQSNQAVMRLFG